MISSLLVLIDVLNVFTQMKGLKTSLFLAFLLSLSIKSAAIDRINTTVPLKDGETIVSSGGNFELGFFSPGNSRNRYVGIWYKKISAFTVVWVANRDNPLNDSSGVLQFTGNRNLELLNGVNDTIWSAISSGPAINPVAQILDTGNFVLRDEFSDAESFLWQSFDHFGDTFLPGMKSGVDLKTGLNSYLTSWRSPDDPSTGNYTNKLDPNGVPQFFLSRNSIPQFRSGSWNGLRFGGMVNLKPNPIYTFQFVWTDDEIYYKYELINSSVLSRMVLSPEGVLQRFTWAESSQDWNLYLTANMDNCDRYEVCGANGICNINNSPACGCLKAFTPRSPDDWSTADWSNGCVRKVPLDCSSGEGFLKFTGIKIPDTQSSWYNRTMNLEECEDVCKRNCSCTAYANLDVRDGGSGCILWFGDLFDIRMYNENGQDIYIRLAASVIDRYRRTAGKKRVWIVVISVSVGFLFLTLCLFLYVRRKKRQRLQQLSTEGNDAVDAEQEHVNQSNNEDLELPLFDFSTIAEATDYFSISNKIGQGGYGPVYKGTLKDGKAIAVKRLSSTSRQGIDQFKNEVLCIAKLQHRNLVRLLGCCIQFNERMLIYEFMPNKSLNFFIFDKTQSRLLDWPKRFQIINGVARGLVYLHQDSRLRIIHRDLKASNVLLDYEMNPKISDFGMARSFGGDETSANTSRIVGTYGYMSPEYAVDGVFSVKSDVFSFGVLVLEIVSGKRNRGFSHSDHKLNLLGHAWILHKEGRSLQLMDESFRESFVESEVLRSIHISLLCVQQNPDDRPSMSTVVLMFNSGIALPRPKEPGFFTERNLLKRYSFSDSHETSSNNGVTLTLLEAR